MPSSSKKKKFDPFIHKYVPKHELLSLEEAYVVLKKLGVKPEQLPWIRASDPVAKKLGAKPGDIIRIIRRSPIAGEIIAYRYVISG